MLSCKRPTGQLANMVAVLRVSEMLYCFQPVMSACQYVLENADTSALLMAVVTVIQDIACDHPEIFAEHFKVRC